MDMKWMLHFSILVMSVDNVSLPIRICVTKLLNNVLVYAHLKFSNSSAISIASVNSSVILLF